MVVRNGPTHQTANHPDSGFETLSCITCRFWAVEEETEEEMQMVQQKLLFHALCPEMEAPDISPAAHPARWCWRCCGSCAQWTARPTVGVRQRWAILPWCAWTGAADWGRTLGKVSTRTAGGATGCGARIVAAVWCAAPKSNNSNNSNNSNKSNKSNNSNSSNNSNDSSSNNSNNSNNSNKSNNSNHSNS